MLLSSSRLSRRAFLLSAAAVLGGVRLPPALAEEAAGMQLLLLGTQGGPNFSLDRAETASAVLIDGHAYLVDCGYGTFRALQTAGVPFLGIGEIFLTHLHDDHTADLAALLGHQWTQGRVEPTVVYGPFGTDDMVKGALMFNRANTLIRSLDEHRTVLAENMFSGVVIPATDTAYPVFEDNRVRISAVENTHYPPEPRGQMPYRSLSYRFQGSDRSIVFSGDTGYSANLVELARGADVLVCEAIHVAATRQAFERMLANGLYKDAAGAIWQHIIDTHTSTEDAGRMAAAAGVKTLVLNHLLPGALQEIPDATYIDGASRHFPGEVIIARDQLRL